MDVCRTKGRDSRGSPQPTPKTHPQEHVAVLAKFSGGDRDGEVLLSVKSSSPQLAADLVADAQALLCTV